MPDTGENNRLPGTLKAYTAIASGLTPLVHLMKPVLARYGGFKDTVPERLGKFSPVLDHLEDMRQGRKLVYIHAVSVGEASVAMALVGAIKERVPDALVAISTTTFTGRDYIVRNFEPDALFFFPIDLPDPMRRLVDKLKPDCFIDIEVELWPNLFRSLTQAGVPMCLANGRISDRAANPPWFLRGVYRWLFRSFDALFMRSAEDVKRAVALGAPAERTIMAGNLKFAACGEPPNIEERDRTRRMLGVGEEGKLIVAGSTHPGEDEQIIEAWKTLGSGDGEARMHLVLAPRHLEQVERLVRLVKAEGEKVALWTDIRTEGGTESNVRVVIVDTIGELMRLYGAADVAFVGGSLISRGGHNVLEPVAMGVPTLHGPSMSNFHDLEKLLGEEKLIFRVADKVELAESIKRIIKEIDPARYRVKARGVIGRQVRAADVIGDWVAQKLVQ